MKNRVLWLRKLRGMTQGQLSQRTGIHRGTISRIERGKGNATLEQALRIGKVFGVAVEDIFMIEEENKNENASRIRKDRDL